MTEQPPQAPVDWASKAAEHRRTVVAAGGWCAPSETVYDLSHELSAVRGGLRYPSVEQIEQEKRRREQWEHEHRWQFRRNRLKGALLLRPVRQKVSNYIHRNCDPD